ncbi:hypothetical protein EUGRSUZ_L03336 [Eucalyptus grandis]|uniref:Uncharacterized protein n=1 Tax=Eucalyptus grandis TaxID=71139 RepID=A0AAD9T7P9_EUCGR|nr:hypothetical protein EUGRSUZ_L03336 [Eucalyptus grandis]
MGRVNAFFYGRVSDGRSVFCGSFGQHVPTTFLLFLRFAPEKTAPGNPRIFCPMHNQIFFFFQFNGTRSFLIIARAKILMRYVGIYHGVFRYF